MYSIYNHVSIQIFKHNWTNWNILHVRDKILERDNSGKLTVDPEELAMRDYKQSTHMQKILIYYGTNLMQGLNIRGNSYCPN